MHTHYDNLKVSRDAPAEVIRAAYKSLSQKYHPDRHADSEEANRVMRLLNAAYEVLRDPARRAEHDQWIAAEEKREADQKLRRAQAQRAAAAAHARRSTPPPRPAAQQPPRPSPRPSPRPTPQSSASASEARPEPEYDAPPPWRRKPRRARPERPANNGPAMPLPKLGSYALYAGICVAIVVLLGDWSNVADAGGDRAMPSVIKPAQASTAQAVAQAAMPRASTPSRAGKYERPSLTPRGLPWPSHSGYLSGYPVLNDRGMSTLTVDNSRNGSDVLLKLVAVDGNTPLPVRTSFVRGGSSFTMENVSAGSYDVRYQSLDTGEIFRSERFEFAETRETGGVTSYGRNILALQTVPEGKSRSTVISEREFP